MRKSTAVLLIVVAIVATPAVLGATPAPDIALINLSSATVIGSGNITVDNDTTVGAWRAYQKDRLLFISTSVVMPDEQVKTASAVLGVYASNFGDVTVFIATAKSDERLDAIELKEEIIGRINASGAKQRFRLVNDTITVATAAHVSTGSKR